MLWLTATPMNDGAGIVTVLHSGQRLRAIVLRDDGETVRVRFARTGKERTVKRSRVLWPNGHAPTPKLDRSPDYGAAKLRPVSKPRPASRDEKYLRFVRKHPCAVCGTSRAIEAHHFGPRSMGRKASDYRATPLCTSCHREWHDGNEPHGLDRAVCRGLFYEAQVSLLLEWFGFEGESE